MTYLKHKNISSLLFVVFSLMKQSSDLAKVFVEQSGTQTFLEFYQTNLADPKYKKSYAKQNIELKKQVSQQFNTEFQEPTSPKGVNNNSFVKLKSLFVSQTNSPVKKIDKPVKRNSIIPLLSLPTQNGEDISISSRVSRRFGDSAISSRIDFKSLKLTSDTIQKNKEEKVSNYFGGLAKKLGELYIGPDLTTLIKLKRDIDMDFPQSVPNSGGNTPQNVEPATEIDLIINSPHEIAIKRFIVLSILEIAYSMKITRSISRNPTNFLMVELNRILESQSKIEDRCLKLIFKILGHYSSDTEVKHFSIWRNHSYQTFKVSEKDIFKFDIFFSRWKSLSEYYVSFLNLILSM